MIEYKSISKYKQSCQFNTGDIDLRDSGSIDNCIFNSDSLRIVESNEEDFSITSSLEYGFGSCSSIVVHKIESQVEIIWSGCINLKKAVIEKALQGFDISSMNLLNESEGTSCVITVANASIYDVKSRFNKLFFR